MVKLATTNSRMIKIPLAFKFGGCVELIFIGSLYVTIGGIAKSAAFSLSVGIDWVLLR